jgi:hypothetical protein
MLNPHFPAGENILAEIANGGMLPFKTGLRNTHRLHQFSKIKVVQQFIEPAVQKPLRAFMTYALEPQA